jgi:hypothetical protein
MFKDGGEDSHISEDRNKKLFFTYLHAVANCYSNHENRKQETREC